MASAAESPKSRLSRAFERSKPYIPMISLQFGYAGMNIISKVSLTNGMSHYVLETWWIYIHGGHASCQDRSHVNSFPCHLIVRGDRGMVSKVYIIFQLNLSSKHWSSIFIHT